MNSLSSNNPGVQSYNNVLNLPKGNTNTNTNNINTHTNTNTNTNKDIGHEPVGGQPISALQQMFPGV